MSRSFCAVLARVCWIDHQKQRQADMSHSQQGPQCVSEAPVKSQLDEVLCLPAPEADAQSAGKTVKLDVKTGGEFCMQACTVCGSRNVACTGGHVQTCKLSH